LRRRIARFAGAGPVLLGAAWLLSFFAPLLSPGRVLANRDIPLFHLPLRASFRLLVEGGSPLWSPWLNGGQPVLSNPSYAAFYPPGWIVFLVPPAYALSLLVVLHAAVAFAGAWWLARRLGAGRGAAALAALGYTGSGASLSLISALTLFCSMAWFPWVIGFADAALRAEPGEPGKYRRWLRPALLAGLALALQLLNGEPATVVITGLGVLAVAVAGAPRHARSLPRVLVPLTLALLLAAVQWLPTWGRLAGSPRAGGLEARRATVWSAPPARVLELAFPRFFGDPARDHEKLFFGWNLHDRDYPYVPSIYPGLLLTVLAVAALAQWPVPRRAAWIFAFAVGAFLALGRHNPLYEPLREAVPVLAVLRFPEKFAILSVAAIVFAGALGWGWLIRERGEGRPERADFPLALSLVLLALAGTLTGLLYRVPRLAEWFVRTHGGPGMTPEKIQNGILYLRGEGWAALLTSGLVAALLALCRWRRPPARLLTGLALALLAADLWHYGHGLVQVAPAGLYQGPPPVKVRPATRLYVQETSGGNPDFVPRRGAPALAPVRASIDRMEPYSALLWRIPYALNEDFDLMLTRWASRAVDTLHQDWGSRASENALRYLGAWNVGTLMLRKDAAEWVAESKKNPRAPLMRVLENPYVLPRYRFVPRAVFHRDFDSALAAARAEGFALMRREHAIRPGVPEGETVYPRLPEPLKLTDLGGRLRLRYRSASRAFFVVAATFDGGWRAEVDGEPVPAFPTAACQIGVELPEGGHVLELRYRDPLVPAGAGVSLLALAATGLLLIRGGRASGLATSSTGLSMSPSGRPASSSDRSMTSSGGATTSLDHPRTSSDGPTTSSGRPKTSLGLAMSSSGLPTTSSGLPTTSSDRPTTSLGLATSSSDCPTTSSDRPSSPPDTETALESRPLCRSTC
jgi:hypothetical protein